MLSDAGDRMMSEKVFLPAIMQSADAQIGLKLLKDPVVKIGSNFLE